MSHPGRGQRLSLEIAGVGIQLAWNGGSIAQECTWPFYEPFLRSASESSRNARRCARLRVLCGEVPDVAFDELIFDARSNHWRLHRSHGRYAFEIFSTSPPHPRTLLALMSADFRTGDIYMEPERDAVAPAWSLTRLMRPFGELLIVNLLQGDGALLHALGVNDHGRGLLFVGASGAGKTTLSELYKTFGNVSILSDERVIVTRVGGEFRVSGTPWPGGGFAVSAETVPLRDIFFLEHGPRNALIPDRRLALHGLLFQQMFLPFWNRGALGFAMTFADDLVRSLPTHRLSFVNDASVIEFLEALTTA